MCKNIPKHFLFVISSNGVPMIKNPDLFLDMIFTHEGERYYLEYGTFRFSWDGKLQWYLTLDEAHASVDGSNTVFKGLCGNYNENPSGKHNTLLFY